MTAPPRISIVTPSYNQAVFLERTLRSVLDQRYPNLQYGVVDGASDDRSAQIIDRYRDQLDFAIIEPDKGQVDALNKGLRRCDGDIVCYLNSDDTLLPGSLDAVGRYFAEHPDVDWVAGDCVVIDEHDRRLDVARSTHVHDLAHALIRDEPFNLPQPGVFWRRSLLERFGLFRDDLHYCFDYEMWCRFLASGLRPVKLDLELATYRMHDLSKTCASQHRFLQEHVRVERQYAHHLPLPRRLTLMRGIGYRTRQHLVATARHRPWGAIARRPWWLGSRQVMGLLVGGAKANVA